MNYKKVNVNKCYEIHLNLKSTNVFCERGFARLQPDCFIIFIEVEVPNQHFQNSLQIKYFNQRKPTFINRK